MTGKRLPIGLVLLGKTMPVDSRNVNHYLGRDLTRPQEMKSILKNDTVLIHSSKHIP